tara:strand:+ start:7255 stop:9531 length:2277 start_codon:yes stop_codon:yes gene_type:complete
MSIVSLAKGLFKKFIGKTDDVPRSSAPREAPQEFSTSPAPVDQVDTGISKREQGRQIALTRKQIEKDELKKLAEGVKLKPLHMGRETTDFGSAIYDQVALDPSKKAMSVDYWLQKLSNPKYQSQQTVPGTTGVKRNITREELEDTNIAIFNPDKPDELIGGLLKVAKDMNKNVSKKVILNAVVRSPAVRSKIVTFRAPKEYKKLQDSYFDEYDNIFKDLEQKVRSAPDNTPVGNMRIDDATGQMLSPLKTNQLSAIQSARKNLYERKVQLDEYYQNLNKFGQHSTGRETFELPNSLAELTRDRPNLSDNVTALTSAQRRELLEDAFEKTYGENLGTRFEKLSKLHNTLSKPRNFKTPIYANEHPYRVHGPLEYVEDVYQIPPDLMPAKNLSQAHFGQVPNVIAYSRYGIRHVDGNPNVKVAAIDEIQSDAQKQALKTIKREGGKTKRVNTFNLDAAKLLYEDDIAIRQARGDVLSKELRDNAQTLPNDQRFRITQELNTINDEVKALQNTANMAGESIPQDIRSNADFLPFLNPQSYNDFVIKNVIKNAPRLDPEVQWVAVNPTTRTLALKQTGETKGKGSGLAGNWLNYGAPDGSTGIPGVFQSKRRPNSNELGEPELTDTKGTAFIPEVFKKLAKQYGTEAKTIKIAKSDITKPFKIIGSEAQPQAIKNLKYKNMEATNEHYGAFATEAEAKQALMQRIDSQSIPANIRLEIKEMDEFDKDLYYEAFALKITPEMRGTPFKLYKKTGGLVVDLFKW